MAPTHAIADRAHRARPHRFAGVQERQQRAGIGDDHRVGQLRQRRGDARAVSLGLSGQGDHAVIGAAELVAYPARAGVEIGHHDVIARVRSVRAWRFPPLDVVCPVLTVWTVDWARKGAKG